MRIIAGTLGGRTFNSPHGHRTHPMSEKMRGAIFGALGDIQDLTVLDVYSGSGAIAYEAVSRGAIGVVSVESDIVAQRAIRENIDALGLTKHIKLIGAHFSSWSNRHPNMQFDLVTADPAYDDITLNDMKRLGRHLKDSGTIVLSWPGHDRVLPIAGLSIVQHKTYGDSQLVFYQKVS
jgi:16S rRNA (guanine966-N2)-methyltransferase